MRFAVLGDHPDALAFAGAAVDSGRHQIVACTAPVESLPPRCATVARRVADIEEILADPTVEAVLVAGAPSVRVGQLRRALQSERHVLCVHPPEARPEGAYEAAMLQRDAGCVLLPLLSLSLHPALRRLGEFIHREGADAAIPPGPFRLLLVERCERGEVLHSSAEGGRNATCPDWDVLRQLGGELLEVSSLAQGEELDPACPVLLSGLFEKGGLFQVTLLPHQPTSMWRLTVVGTLGRVVLFFPQGSEGPAFLEWTDTTGERREEVWERWDGWPALLEVFEAAVAGSPVGRSWEDAVRALELDDAVRQSVSKRRVNRMEYQRASEEVGFKGTMTLVGCGMLWAVLLLLIGSVWRPWLGWLILPLLLIFVGLQLLRYVIPTEPPGSRSAE